MPSKLEQLQLQFRQKLLLEKEEKMVKINNDNQPKPETKISVNGNGIQQKNSASLHPPFTPSPKANASPSARYLPSAKKTTPSVDRSRPISHIQKNTKLDSPSSNTVSSPGSLAHVRGVAENGGISTRSPLSEYKPSATKSIQNGKAKLSGETFKVVHTETRIRQVEVEKPKLIKKPISDKETRTKVNTPSTSSRTPEHKDMADGKPHNISSKSRIRQESKCTPTRREPLPVKKPVNGAVSKISKSQSDPNLAECTICGRRFAKDRIEKHTSICKKSAQKPRKIFDATKMRVKGTEAESFLRKKNVKNDVKPKKSNWRKQHENFLASIREAKAVQRHLAAGGKISDLPPPTPSDTSDYVPCPYCKRKFNEGAASRHIPKCKNILSNKKARK